MTTAEPNTKSRWWQAFLWALCIGVAMYLPFLLSNSGLFIYYGDFNVQQIPFYKLAHEAVRSGDLFWNWYTDLGVNFIGSYSFYLLFSPFFWLTLPFPTHWVPYLMAPLLILKTAFAASAACAYLERFVRDRAYAVVGGLLYAMSGWMFFNIFFNHFHDVAVFFPLLLLALEQLVCDDRKCVFALAVAVNAMVNYWFFVGEVVFVILYVAVRTCTRGWRMTPGKFLRLTLEAVLGVGLSAAAMMPSVLAIMGNPRTGTDNLLKGWNFWLYGHNQRVPAIIQSLFFPPELPAKPNFLPDHGAKWASLSGWLPMVGMTGVLAYFFQRKNDWVKRLLAVCLVFALVPGLNSLFILLNHSYYARWFYMPILIMSLATVRALEDSAFSSRHFSRAIKWSAIVVVVFTVMCGLTPNLVQDEWKLGMEKYPDLLWAYAILAVIGLLLVALLVVNLRHSKQFLRLFTGVLALYSLVFGIFFIFNGKNTPEKSRWVINTAIGGREQISLPPGDSFERVDVYDEKDLYDNLAMFWHLPTIQCFHSIVPPSIMEFYPAVGVKRDVGSRPEADHYALRPLLSVRWLFIGVDDEKEQEPMPGYQLYTEQAGHYVYKNLNYIPMGFGYDQFILWDELESVDMELRANLMLRAIVLEEEAILRHEDIMTWLDLEEPLYLDENRMAADAEDRRAQSAYSFRTDNRGFTALSDLDRDTLLFFSVPWEAGWSATVNGQEALIERVNVGFMAVRVPAGQAEIRFDYTTPGLNTGLLITGGSLLLWVGYALVVRRRQKNQPVLPEPGDLPDDPTAMSFRFTAEEYSLYYGDKRARASRLQQAINQAAAAHIPQELEPVDRTLPFHSGEDGEPPVDGGES